jgi:exopolyphosphatase/pppGpp-phosphohydrolase
MSPLSHDVSVTEILQQSYAAARQHLAVDSCIVVLHIGAEQSGIAVGLGSLADLVKMLPMGSERTAREYFKTTPPTPLAMEHAIQVVEDVVMPLRAVIPREAHLFSTDAMLREIALLAGAEQTEPMRLTLEAMERIFNRLGAVVEGSPAAHQGVPESNGFAAALLILREFMHHLQFAQIEVLHAP